MLPGLFIVSVYRPDIYDEALRSTGVARDVEVVLDRRMADRRIGPRGDDSASRDRRQFAIDEQLRTEGWIMVSAEQRAHLQKR